MIVNTARQQTNETHQGPRRINLTEQDVWKIRIKDTDLEIIPVHSFISIKRIKRRHSIDLKRTVISPSLSSDYYARCKCLRTGFLNHSTYSDLKSQSPLFNFCLLSLSQPATKMHFSYEFTLSSHCNMLNMEVSAFIIRYTFSNQICSVSNYLVLCSVEWWIWHSIHWTLN